MTQAIKRASALLGLCTGLWWMASAVGSAQAPRESSYEQIVAEALVEFGAGRYLESRALFMEAHALKASARTLRGMGQAAFHAQLYAQAIADLSAALQSDVHKLTPKLRREAESVIARARTYTGRFWVKLDPQQAELLVDGEPAVFDEDGALLLDVGARQVLVRANGKSDREVSLRVIGGEETSLSLNTSLEPTPAQLDAAPVATAEALDPAPRRPFKPSQPRAAQEAPRPFPWLATGAFGLAAVGLGTGFFFMDQSANIHGRWLRQGCMSMADSTCDFFRRQRQQRITWEVASFSLAGAFAITGVILLVTRGQDEDDSETALSCGLGAVGLGCRLQM
jgi:hypothetical protein